MIEEWKFTYSKIFEQTSDIALFRAFRDDYLMKKSTVERSLVTRFYRNSSASLKVINSNPDFLAQAKTLIRKNSHAIRDTLEGKTGSIRDTDEALVFLDNLINESPNDLKNLLTNIKEGIIKSRQTGKPFLGLLFK